MSSVTPGYFDVMRIPLLRGRGFTGRDGPDAPEVAVISASMAARYWPDGDPIGDRLVMADGVEDEERSWQIVGVVGDVRRTAVQEEAPEVHVYIPQWQRGTHFTDWQIAFPKGVTVVARSAVGATPVVAGVRDAIWSLAPDQAILWIGPMVEYVYQVPEMAEQRFYTLLLGILGAISLVLAVGGLYGVIAFLTAQRTYEIGVRMALGARREQVVRLILSQSLALVLLGVVLGLAGATALTRVLESWLFGVESRDAATYALTAGLLVGAALVASLVPARRAASTDPMLALRAD